ncbi:MAG: DNA primase catalytic subunit PriS [Candidatus Micrarchaeaceae archaeon]
MAPRSVSSREFGFGDFERKISYRHYGFADDKALKSYLAKEAPAFVSYSFSEYDKPAARPMESKGWIGGDLVFDIDAGDLNLKCRFEHSSSWVCAKCLEGVKDEAVKLVEEFLIPDFGFQEDDISINFSGNRGYHIHVRNEKIFKLDGDARKEIGNYITGNGIDLGSFFPTLGRRGVRLEGPKPTDHGWGGKLANGVIKALGGGISGLMELGIDKKTAEMLTRKHAEVALGITTGNWDKIDIPKKAELWSNVLKSIAISQSDAIDKNVSTDIYHLIRLPGSIHGDTGLAAKAVKSLKAFGRFDPMDDAVVFDDAATKVRASNVPKFAMHGSEFGPYGNEDVVLPRYAAVYLMLKRLAVLAP